MEIQWRCGLINEDLEFHINSVLIKGSFTNGHSVNVHLCATINPKPQ